MTRNGQRRTHQNTSHTRRPVQSQQRRQSTRTSKIQDRLGRRYHGDCRICNADHPLRTCSRFLNLLVPERLAAVKRHGYCINCLAFTHHIDRCNSFTRCRKCNQRHHSLLHIDKKRDLPDEPRTDATSTPLLQRVVTLQPTIAVKLCYKTESGYYRAILNACEPISKIASDLVKKYKLKIDSFGEQKMCTFEIMSRRKADFSLKVTAIVNDNLPLKMPDQDVDEAITTNYANLTLADPKFFKRDYVHLIFGTDVFQKVIQPGVLHNNSGLPVAQNTLFGWVIVGTFGL